MDIKTGDKDSQFDRVAPFSSLDKAKRLFYSSGEVTCTLYVVASLRAGESTTYKTAGHFIFFNAISEENMMPTYHASSRIILMNRVARLGSYCEPLQRSNSAIASSEETSDL